MALATAVGLSIVLAVAGASAQSTSTIGLVGADSVIQGNTATTIGARDPCVSVNVGQRFPVDIIVDEVPADRPIIGFQVEVKYDQALLSVVEADHDFLLGATGSYQPFPGLSDALPDADGEYKVTIADLASNAGSHGANSETGPGVLSRLTFEAKAAGTSLVGPVFEGNTKYPALQDIENIGIEIVAMADTLVAVGQPCPADVTPEEQTTVLPPQAEIQAGNVATRTLAPGEPVPGRTSAPRPATDTPAPTEEGGGEGPSPTPECITPTASPEAGSETPAASETPTPDPAASPSAAPLPTCEPTVAPTTAPTPDSEENGSGIDEEEGSDTAAIIAGATLGVVGLAAVGSGGWLLFRRRPAGP
jgi:hypothetical protein